MASASCNHAMSSKRMLHLLVIVLLDNIHNGQSLSLIDSAVACPKNGCFGSTDCTSSANTSDCAFLLTAKDLGNGSLQIEMQGSDLSSASTWLAVGFSDIGKMDDGLATVCFWNGNQLKVVLNQNNGKSGSARIAQPNLEPSILTPIDGGVVNGHFICRFQQRLDPGSQNSNGQIPNLLKPWYLLLAKGTNAVVGNMNVPTVNFHTTRTLSSAKMNISKLVSSSAGAAAATSKYSPEVLSALSKSHGILMILAWWLFIPTGIFFARYFRALWPNKKPLGTHVWFTVHRPMQLFATLCVLVGLICILVVNDGRWLGGEADPTNLHAITGLTCVICAFIQPFLAVFRCHPGTKWRPLFNWPHRIIGISAFAISGYTIWKARFFVWMGLDDASRPSVLPIMIFYFVIVLVTSLVLELHITLTERLRVGGAKEHPANHVAMGAVNNGWAADPAPVLPPSLNQTGPRKSWAYIRSGVLGVFIISALGVTITLSVFIGTKTN